MRGITRMLVVAGAVALAAPVAPAAAQVRSFTLCNAALQFCSGIELTLVSQTQLQVDLRNLGVPSGLDSFLSAFGIFGLGPQTGTLTTATFNGPVVDLLAASSGGNNERFAEDGAGSDLQGGVGTQPLQAGVDFSNDGFRPCSFGDQTNGGTVRYATCLGEEGSFLFDLSGPITLTQFNNLGVGIRAQNLGPNGNGSDKCFSAGDADCTFTNTVPEPATVALMATGLLGMVGFARRRRQG